MDGYAAKILEELEHIFPKKRFYGPSNTNKPTYGIKVQYIEEDLSKSLSRAQYKAVKKNSRKVPLLWSRHRQYNGTHNESYWSTKSKGTQKLL